MTGWGYPASVTQLTGRAWLLAQLARSAFTWLWHDTRYPSPVPENPRFMSPRAAAALIRNGDVIAAYANSDWAAPPAAMLEQRLRSALADGGWRAVVGPASNAQADFTLHVSVDDFSQVFTSPRESFGVLDATVTMDGANDALVAQRHFHFRVAAPGADAAGGVKALDTASQDFANQLRDWLRAQQPNRS